MAGPISQEHVIAPLLVGHGGENLHVKAAELEIGIGIKIHAEILFEMGKSFKGEIVLRLI